MKKQTTVMAFFATVSIFFLFSSCQNNDNYIIGKWEIENVGTSDPTTSEGDIHSLSVINMLSVGGTFSFNDKGEFKTETTSGSYSISSDGNSITLKDSESEHTFDLNKTSDKKLQLKSTTDKSVINLVKK